MSRLLADMGEILRSEAARSAGGWGKFHPLGVDMNEMGDFTLAFAGYEIDSEDENGNLYLGREGVRIDLVFQTFARASDSLAVFPVQQAFAFLYGQLATERLHTRIRFDFPRTEEIDYLKEGKSKVGGLQSFHVFAAFEANLTA